MLPKTLHKPLFNRLLFCLVLIVTYFALYSSYGYKLKDNSSKASIIGLTCIIFWATNIVPLYLTSILFFVICAFSAIVPREIIFTGFTSEAFWLILSGMVIGVACKKVGLIDRIAMYLISRLPTSYGKLILSVTFTIFLLSFIIPSNMARLAIFVPILLGMAERLGFRPGSKGFNGIIIAASFANFCMSAAILPSNVSNLVMVGAMKATYNINIGYLSYLILHLPTVAILKGLLISLIVTIQFNDKPNFIEEKIAFGKLSKNELKLAGIITITILFWITDKWHGIPAAWVALSSAALMLMPRLGLLNETDFNTKVSFSTCIYIASLISLSAVIKNCNVDSLISENVLKVVTFTQNDFLNYIKITLLTNIFSFITTSMVLFTPLASKIADLTNFDLHTVLQSQVLGYSTVILPYQCAPVIVALHMAKVKLREATKFGLISSFLSIILIMPMNYLWWKIIGLL